MPPATARPGIRSGGRGILRILDAKAGFALDRLETIVEGRKIAAGRSAGEIGAPRLVLLIALGLRAINERAPNTKDRDRYK
jgi:hypothetical protein